MKSCKACMETKPIGEFYSNGVSYTGAKKYKPTCKACEQTSDMTRYYKIIEDHYGHLSCSKCGYDKCLAALELHHTDPETKEYQVSTMRNYSEKKIKSELAKCEIVCANCHREIHRG